jgi:hypothetical protein
LIIPKYLDYHHVYSYVVASKNFLNSSYPATTQDTPPATNTVSARGNLLANSLNRQAVSLNGFEQRY